jgi:Carboxypeptidase regulatory-like domain/TonB-dependent Receptor Plug Domain
MHRYSERGFVSALSHGQFPYSCLLRTAAKLLILAVLMMSPALHAQATAELTGNVADPTAAVIPDAKILLTNDATKDQRSITSNSAGSFTFAALLPGTYTLSVSMKGFKGYQRGGIVLDAGDIRAMPPIVLQLGDETQTITVEADSQIIPLVSGERAAILNSKDIERLTLGSRDLSELLQVLPGVTISPSGLNNSPGYNFESVSTGQSAVGNGIVANGVPNKGATSLLLDNVDILDPGCDCNAIALINPDMTAEVSVQTSNFGAQAAYGPVVVSVISKSGSAKLHGQGYFYARNNVLDANTWTNDNQHIPLGSAHYYYPGGSVGGPLPYTHDKLLWWGGFERLLQNSGNSNVLQSFIPTADMIAGNFGPTAANTAFCLGASNINSSQTNGCNDLTGTVLPDGTTAGPGTANGSTIPSQFISPGAIALSKVWPTANANPVTTPGNYNYYEPIPDIHDGWLYRLRVDYNMSENTKFFISYQQGYDSELSNGNGAHIYYTPGNAIPYPGGGLVSSTYTKALSGHFTHIFSPTLTNEFVAAWGYGNFPVAPANPSAATRSSIGYPYGTLFDTGSTVIPAYNSAGYETFPDFSEGDIIENPQHSYLVRKEIPSFEDNLTKVWGNHTVKIGLYAETVPNAQGSSENPNGDFTSFGFGGTLHPNLLTGSRIGSPNNPTANFLMGLATGYTESSSEPNADLAYQYDAGYIDDLWKVSKKLTLELGLRVDHIGHWYDQARVGVAAFLPQLAASDYSSGKMNPGIYYHAINPGIPNSGMPDRFAWLDPRFGLSYDILGNGKTLIRGGWGMYRFGDQNTYAPAVTTSDSVLTYTLPNNTSVLESQVPSIAAPTTSCSATSGPGGTPCINGSVYAVNPTDYQIPLTISYNLTIDQQLPWNVLFEAAYVGNQSQNIPLGGEDISGGGFLAFDNVNKMPLGALFKPDPVTGATATNPEDVTSTCSGGVCNKTADYRPYGKEYGDNPIYVFDTAGYSNYNGLQLSAVKRGKTASFNINYTFSKTLATYSGESAFDLRRNYGISPYSRTHVFNVSGAYTLAKPYKGSERLISGVANGWTFSTVTTLQSGGNLQATNNPNFGLSLQYLAPNGAPVSASNPLPNGATGNSLGSATYYGTTDTEDITPEVTCNPTAGLSNRQRIKYSCFAPPPIGAYGPRNYGYTMAAYFNTNISMFKAFPIAGDQSVEFRLDAFNWINHPLPQFSGGSQLALSYQHAYGSGSFTPNTANFPSGNPKNFGVMNTKAGDPNERTLELSVKYRF